jgi:SAM-dependent methyltransferase
MPDITHTEIVHGSIYDFPKYYDILFGADWKAEFDFIQACSQKYGKRRLRRIYEPACGTGRLMIKLAQAGYEVAGNDLNPKAVEYCNQRLVRQGFPPTAVVEDMSDFRVKKPFDLAFNFINTFRHLPTEDTAESHLHCMAQALAPGGLYLLGIHLIPEIPNRMESEAWVAKRGLVTIRSLMWCKELDLKGRNEHLGMTLDVSLPTRTLRLVDTMDYRTYTRQQMARLLRRVPDFELVACHDFHYEIDHPFEVGPDSEDVVYVLRRRS